MIDQEVGRLDVAMDDAQTMGVVKRVGRFGTQTGDIAAKARSRCMGPNAVNASDWVPWPNSVLDVDAVSELHGRCTDADSRLSGLPASDPDGGLISLLERSS